MMGITSVDLAAMVAGFTHKPLAFGANCGVGASDLLRTMTGVAQTAPDIPMIAKGNAGIPKFVDGHIHYDGTPELMADYACLARDLGVKLIGGCCGSQPEHLSAMRAALETRDRQPMPNLETISSSLGAFSSDSDGTGKDAANAASGRTRRSRRRA